MFLKKGVLKICSKFKGERPCENTLQHGCSPVNVLHISEYLFIKTPTNGCFCLRISSINFPADLVTFTEETNNGKLHFLCGEMTQGDSF